MSNFNNKTPEQLAAEQAAILSVMDTFNNLGNGDASDQGGSSTAGTPNVSDDSAEDFKVSIERLITEDENIQYKVIIRHVNGVIVSCMPTELNSAVDQLINAGVLMNNEVCSGLQMKIQKAILEANNNPNCSVTKHTVIGWKQIKDSKVYLGNKAIGLSDCESVYDGSLISCAGTINGWVDSVNKYIVPKVVPSIVFASALAGVIRQRYPKYFKLDGQLILGLIGATSTGKTSLSRMVMSTYTNPLDTLGDYFSTSNALYETLTCRGPLLNVVDDILRLPELKANPDNIIDVLFSFSSGHGKSRLTSSAALCKRKEFYGPIIVSATDSILESTVSNDYGQSRRLIELDIKPGAVAASAEELDEMITAFGADYGLAAETFAEGLIKSVDEKRIIAIYNNWKAKFGSMQMSQLASRYAMITTCAELSNMILHTEYDMIEIEKYLKNVAAEVYEMFYNRKVQIIPSRGIEQRISEYFIKHAEYFRYSTFESEAEMQRDLPNLLGTAVINKGRELVIRLPIMNVENYSFDRDDNTPYILLDEDPKKILEEPDSLPNYDIENYEEVMSRLRKTGMIQAKDRGFKKKATITKGWKQVNSVVEFHSTVTPEIENAIQNTTGYTKPKEKEEQSEKKGA